MLPRLRLLQLCALVPCLLITVGLAHALPAAGVGTAAGAWSDPGSEFLARIQGALAAGRMSEEQALLLQFQYGFDPAALPSEYRPAAVTPLKCVTELVQRYRKERHGLSAATVEKIDAWLAPSSAKSDESTYDSPGGRFTLTYSLTGDNAVSPADIDPPDGVPDYVEQVASYFDHCWTLEVDSLGFAAPPLDGGRYQVGFQSMNIYGYTVALATPPGATRITLHNNFFGFPANDDPDGIALGAAKVSAAHEFKHATQQAGSYWSEGGWVELDATWMEDIAYDQVNDYYNFLPRGSPISNPEQPLDYGGTGSYEDCVFEHWLSETWGVRIIQDLWTWRESHRGEDMLASYDRMLAARGTGLTAAWPTFAVWNFACGARAVAGFGYEEAAGYPSSHLAATLSSYPQTVSGTAAHLSARFVRCSSLPTGADAIRVHFSRQDSSEIQCSAVIETADGPIAVEPIDLKAGNEATRVLSTLRNRIVRLAFVVSNGGLSGPDETWSMVVEPITLHPAVSLSARALTDTLVQGHANEQVLRLANAGDAGSNLSWNATVAAGSWLTVSPAYGSLPRGGEVPLTLSFDASALAPGFYSTTLVVSSTAPSSPDSVAVDLVVQADRSGLGHLPLAFRIEENRPNPFNPVTELALAMPAASRATLEVLDVRGRVVRRLHAGELPAGRSLISWDGRDDTGLPVPSGVYLARLQSGSRISTLKMLLTR